MAPRAIECLDDPNCFAVIAASSPASDEPPGESPGKSGQSGPPSGRAEAVARRGLRRRLVEARPIAVLIAAFVVMLVYAFPGQMTRDSLDHLREARLGVYTDSHPPFINLLFKVSDAIVAGPIGMLLLQNLLLLAGLYAILKVLFAPRRAAWIAAAIYISPPVLPVMAVIWKDCFMAGFLAVGLAGLLSPRRSRRLWGLAALCAATAMRYNAFGATLPLIVLLFEWRPGMHWLARYATALALWLVVTFAAFTVNSALTDRPMHFWHSSLAVFDIVGTYANVEDEIPDAQMLAELEGTGLLIDRDIQATMRTLYSPRTFFPIILDPKLKLWSLPISGFQPAPQAQRDAIARAFWHVVTTHPRAYASHRLAAAAAPLDLESRRRRYINKRAPTYLEYAQELGLSTASSVVQGRFMWTYYWISRGTPLLVPWVYLVLSLLLLPMAMRQRDVIAILLSGLVIESSLLFLAHSTDYRYSHWMVISTILSAIFVGVRRHRGARPARMPLAVGVSQ
jgi:hypothetical protein